MTRLAILSAAVLMAVGGVFSVPVNAGAVQQRIAQVAVVQSEGLEVAAMEAIAADGARAEAAIGRLRAAGYAGLDALLAAAPMQTETMKSLLVTPIPEVMRFKWAVDRVAMQKDASVSRLFWYTDMEAAKAEAGRTGKPILSLRMLGKLNEDLSCANSRFFRTTLYANAEISGYLREHFILHWESVRPVPVVTIDMGDGRRLVRTITGNSIHYVLDAKGRVVDGLPGLYGPKAFLAGLKVGEAEANAVGAMRDGEFSAALKEFQARRVEGIRGSWRADLEKAGVAMGNAPIPVSLPVDKTKAPGAIVAGKVTEAKRKAEAPILARVAQAENPPRAVAAGELAATKWDVEGAAIKALGVPDQATLDSATDDAMWLKIAALHAEDARLDAKARELIRSKTPAAVAAKLTISKASVESPLVRMVRSLEGSIALDTVKNEYRLHPKICEWLGQSTKPMDLKALNERVYAQLFLTPSSDPWLGLAPADAFAAIDDGGGCVAAKK